MKKSIVMLFALLWLAPLPSHAALVTYDFYQNGFVNSVDSSDNAYLVGQFIAKDGLGVFNPADGILSSYQYEFVYFSFTLFDALDQSLFALTLDSVGGSWNKNILDPASVYLGVVYNLLEDNFIGRTLSSVIEGIVLSVNDNLVYSVGPASGVGPYGNVLCDLGQDCAVVNFDNVSYISQQSVVVGASTDSKPIPEPSVIILFLTSLFSIGLLRQRTCG